MFSPTRSRSVLLALVLAVFAGIVAASPASHARAVYPSPNCGTTIYKADGSKWTCTFDDEFSTTSLDTSKWAAWNGVNYNTGPATCYYDDASRLWVRNGYLNLAVTRLAKPASCSNGSSTMTSTYGGAVVHTQGKFNQTRGRFEARIQFGGGVGIHDDYWLYPSSTTYPGQAEIDIAEPWGAWPDTMSAVTHMTGSDGKDDGSWTPCTISRWSSGFHTYAVEWTSAAITFVYDGVKCGSYSGWTPLAGFASPAPFDQPFFMILQTLADDGSYSPSPDASTIFPAVTQVDYVRVWK